jgi:hypothetical protein
MARAQEDNRSLRFSRADTARLVAALLLSAFLHVTIWGAYQIGNRLDLWHRLHLPTWVHHAPPVQVTQKPKAKLVSAKTENEEPTIFVDVSQADADTPTKTKYYSDRSSRAANPDVAKANAPKITGTQRDVPKTESATRPVKATSPAAAQTSPENQAQAAQPAPPAANPAIPTPTPPELANLHPTEPTPSQTPVEPLDTPPAILSPGETDLRPKPAAVNPPATTPQTARPRTIRQALAQNDQLPGLKMQQDGGVTRHALSSSLDVKGTPFGEYDRALVAAISQRWYDLLDRHRFTDDRSGKVTVRFKLKPDGTVIEMQTLDNTVGELLGYLCQESVEESAPFAKWPPDMVRMVGANYREITFTFYYY